MSRITRGLRLARSSGEILRCQPLLLGIVGAFVVAQAAVMAWYVLGVVGRHSLANGGELGYLRLYPMLVICQVISVLAASVVTFAVADRLKGGSASWSDTAAAIARKGPALIGWALATATVGFVIRALEERLGFIGRIVTGLVGLTWTVATAFMIPVIVLEDAGPVSGIRKSAALVRQRWGEQLTGDTAIGLVLTICAIPLLVAASFGFVAGAAVGVTLVVATIVLVVTVEQALGAVFQVVLYRYAVSGVTAGQFSEDDLLWSYRTGHSRWERPPADPGSGGSGWVRPLDAHPPEPGANIRI